jgi:aminopeptidase-like protein
MTGAEMHLLARRLWPINRSLTGEGVRETLQILKEHLPALEIFEVPSGTQVFDWNAPKEWKVKSAWVRTPDGRKICDFTSNNLHLLGYSTPVNRKMEWSEFDSHLYSLPEQPTAIPYVTSYYSERWGFCLPHQLREALPRQGQYDVFIDSELFDGSLTYAELILPGATDREVFISTYVCHPSMANNELSGPVVTTYIAKWLSTVPKRRFTYRLVFIPETIGSITYLSRNVGQLKSKVDAGFNVTCIGDNRAYSYLPSRLGGTLSDRVAQHVLKWIDPNYVRYSWTDRGSDERQYCAPGIDLPMASIMRTKYGQYPEYHTSLDDLEHVVTEAGLQGGFNALRCALEALEKNCHPRVTVLGEPQLGKRGLYPTISTKDTGKQVRQMMDFLTWSDGTSDLIEIADKCGVPVWDLYRFMEIFTENGLIADH